MVAESKQRQKQLYESDYYLWVVETVKQLQNRDLEAIDWENLIDEVLDLSRREKRKLESLLISSHRRCVSRDRGAISSSHPALLSIIWI